MIESQCNSTAVVPRGSLRSREATGTGWPVFAISAATVLLLEGLALALVALALAIGLGPGAALVLGILLLGAGGATAYLGWRKAPRRALTETLRRPKTDAWVLKEHVA
jgi:protein-S-isoprenylcysteine O-methyltransferase Ste14